VASQDRFQRVTNLLLLLLASPRPLTLDEIASQIAGYPEEHVARRQAFERDKRLLREEGVEVTTVAVPGPAQQGYWVDPDHYYLPSIALSTEERLALSLALATVRVDDRSGEETALQVGADSVVRTDAVALLETPTGLERLDEGVRRGRRVRFSHQGRRRRLDPWAIVFRWGRWYVTGFDPDRQATRTFRVDRLQDVEVTDEPREVAPTEGRAADLVPRQFWQAAPGAPATSAQVAFAPEVAPEVREDLGLPPASRAPSDPSAWVVASLEVGDEELFLSWLFELGDKAVVLGPERLRAAVVDWLERVALGAGPGGDLGAAGPGVEVVGSDARQGAERHRAHGPRTGPRGGFDARRRLRLALRLVPWVVQHRVVSLDEAASVVGLEREQVLDLLLSVACCGLPPYTPDTLVELLVDEDAGTVEAQVGQGLERPPRLSAADALRLGAAARAVLAIEGSDPDGVLASALAKVEATLGERVLSVELDRPRLLGDLQAAAAEHAVVEIDYDGVGRDEMTRRVVEPWRVQAARGRWYVDAWCRSAGALRRFRVDRVRALHTMPGEARLGPTEPQECASLLDGLDDWAPEGPLATIELPAERSRLVDGVPGARFEPGPPGRLRVRLPVRSASWLGLLLVRIGPGVGVVEPEALRHVGADAALQIMRRYKEHEST